MNKTTLFAVFLFLFISGCTIKIPPQNQTTNQTTNQTPAFPVVSFNELISNAEDYNGTNMCVGGYYLGAFEVSALAGRYSEQYGADEELIWIEGSVNTSELRCVCDEPPTRICACRGKVLVCGKFEYRTEFPLFGHLGGYNFQITAANVTVVKEDPDLSVCRTDDDCEFRFTHCSCGYTCLLKQKVPIDCARECPDVESPAIAPKCACINKQCVMADVEVKTDKLEYTEGEHATITVKNNLNTTIWYYPTCYHSGLGLPFDLERSANGEWTWMNIRTNPRALCDLAEFQGILPGEIRSFRWDLTSINTDGKFVGVGTYRLTFSFFKGEQLWVNCSTPRANCTLQEFKVYSQRFEIKRSANATPECSTDSDCVPAQCCHPYSCVRKEDAPDCSLLGVCTASCDGPIDCGAGRCACVNNTCSVVSSAPKSTCPVCHPV